MTLSRTALLSRASILAELLPPRWPFRPFRRRSSGRVLHAPSRQHESGGVWGRSGLDFAGAHELDAKSARQVPADMIGRVLDDGDLRRLQQAITPKKPAAPTVRGRPAAKRSVGKRLAFLPGEETLPGPAWSGRHVAKPTSGDKVLASWDTRTDPCSEPSPSVCSGTLRSSRTWRRNPQIHSRRRASLLPNC